MADYMTFAEIQTEVQRAIKHYKGTQNDLVKHMINMVYMNELMQADDLYPPHWYYAYMRLRLNAPNTITDITAADPGVITSEAHGYVGHEIITFWDIAGMTELNFEATASIASVVGLTGFYIVEYIDADTFSLLDQNEQDVDTSVLTAYTSGGTIFHHGWNMASVLSDLTDVSKVGIHDGNPLEPITWDDFFKSPDSYFSDSQGTPSKFLKIKFFNSGSEYLHIITFPAASEDKIAYFDLIGRPDPLSADGDIPNLPFDFHPAIVAGAITRLAQNDVQVDNQVVWPGIYKSHIKALQNYNRKYWESMKAPSKNRPYLL